MIQKQELLKALLDAGKTGVNSFSPIRERILQLPAVIRVLEDDGYTIHHQDEPNGSTTYRLLHIPPQLKKEAASISAPVVVSEPTESFLDKEQRETSIPELLARLELLREQYRTAESITDQKIIVSRGRAIKNAIAKINPNHPEVRRAA